MLQSLSSLLPLLFSSCLNFAKPLLFVRLSLFCCCCKLIYIIGLLCATSLALQLSPGRPYFFKSLHCFFFLLPLFFLLSIAVFCTHRRWNAQLFTFCSYVALRICWSVKWSFVGNSNSNNNNFSIDCDACNASIHSSSSFLTNHQINMCVYTYVPLWTCFWINLRHQQNIVH